MLSEDVLVAIATVVALGIGAQWLSWRFHIPAILLLLLTGFVAGPVTGLLDPDEMFGDLLVPVVSASVAIVLFEGGLSLSFRELRGTGGVVWRLVSVGAVVTWGIGTGAALLLLGLDLGLSLLVGAMFVVTGPTVIGPLLRNVRPLGRVGPILRWEGILIDPIGAMLAVIVFEAVILGEPGSAQSAIAAGLLEIVAVGGGVGFGAAVLMVLVLKRYLIPDFLHNAVSLAVVLGAFTAANAWVHESGLLAVTVMGIVLANQRATSVRHIIEFKETLRVLLISGLFIVLAARLEVQGVADLGIGGAVFVLALFVARPLSVWVASVGSKLERRERLFLSSVAPRGIVAAAISSVFALRLTEAGHEGADVLAPLAFVVIVGTIAVYGGSAGFVARRLRLSDTNPQGALIVGANPVARAIALALKEEDLRVTMVDTDWGNVSAARLKGLDVSFRSFLSEEVGHQLELGGIGRLLALTPNDELNSLAVQHALHLFGRAEVYQLQPRQGGSPRTIALAPHQRGRILFGEGITYAEIAERLEAGATLKSTPLSEEFDYDAFKERYADTALPLFLLSGNGRLFPYVVDGRPTPKPGDRLITLVSPDAGAASAAPPPVVTAESGADD